MNLSIRTKAIMALILTGILGGIAPLLMKNALKELSVAQIVFIRFGIANILIIPLIYSHFKKIHIKKLILTLPAGILFTGNIFLFVLGLQFTTSIVSQLFYLLAPVLVSLLGYVLFHEKISGRRIVSMTICFIGAALLILRSVESIHLIRSIGTFKGNLFVICAVFFWASYAVYSKKINNKVSPTLFLVTNFLTTFLVSIIFLGINNSSPLATIYVFVHSGLLTWVSLVTLGILNSVIFFFLYQWSLKYVSAFIVASTAYLSPLSTAVFAIPFFGEQLSSILLISAAGIFIGSYFIVTEKR